MAVSQAGDNVQGWVLDRVVGSGSFATVWKAHKRLGESVVYAAVKEIATEKLVPKLKQSLECEVSILKRISHKNVVKLHEVAKVGGPHLMTLAAYTELLRIQALSPGSDVKEQKIGVLGTHHLHSKSWL